MKQFSDEDRTRAALKTLEQHFSIMMDNVQAVLSADFDPVKTEAKQILAIRVSD